MTTLTMPSLMLAPTVYAEYWILKASWKMFQCDANSAYDVTLRRRGLLPVLVTFRRQYSNVWPTGTK